MGSDLIQEETGLLTDDSKLSRSLNAAMLRQSWDGLQSVVGSTGWDLM